MNNNYLNSFRVRTTFYEQGYFGAHVCKTMYDQICEELKEEEHTPSEHNVCVGIRNHAIQARGCAPSFGEQLGRMPLPERSKDSYIPEGVYPVVKKLEYLADKKWPGNACVRGFITEDMRLAWGVMTDKWNVAELTDEIDAALGFYGCPLESVEDVHNAFCKLLRGEFNA